MQFNLCLSGNKLFSLLFALAFFSLSFTIEGQDKILTSRHYETLSEDGAWCWFSDPRSVYIEGKIKQIITGYVSKSGSIVVSSLNTITGNKTEVVLHKDFEKDDHATPSFLILPDKKIMVFYSQHGGKESKIYYTTTRKPEDISEWEETKNITENTPGESGFTYTNPVMLSAEKNRIYLFWRGGNYQPGFAYSDDLGKTWSKAATLIQSSTLSLKRPYIKIATNNIDEIHFAFTDGHPRNEPLNSIYYMKYKKGSFYKADGKRIGSMKNLPIKHESADIVYNAAENFRKTGNGVRAWIWDIAIDKKGMPVLAYTQLPEETSHKYYYARFNGKEWDNDYITAAGKCFPRIDLTKSERDPEPHYSGGIALDHSNPSIVYLSKPSKDIFEIEKWTTPDEGKTWSNQAVTSNSLKDNVRPYVISNASADITPNVLWMYGDYKHYTDYATIIKDNKLRTKPSGELNRPAVINAMRTVADWQLQEPLRWNLTDWTNGALFAGMVEWAKIAEDAKYFNWLMDKGNKTRWGLGDRTYMADDHCVGQMYLEMYRKYKDKKMLNNVKGSFDWIIGNPSKISLKFKSDSVTSCTDRWSWCDAIFMGPTVWVKLAAITGQKKYLDFMENEFKATTEHLYDAEEHLYYRDDRFIGQKEANGKKVFWGRGNGWVLAGLCVILKELPANYPNRKYFEQIYLDMAAKIASLQDDKGYWHASLLDPGSYPVPETSASSFYVYGITWGINNGYLLPEKYKPVVEKGWKALVNTIHPDGKLGYVQPIGESPKNVTEDMTEVYGVGAFLLAGTEIVKLLK
jgi:rhamnogalacturonyl hydrolase YesR